MDLFKDEAFNAFLQQQKALNQLLALVVLICEQDIEEEKRQDEFDYIANQINRLATPIMTRQDNPDESMAVISTYFDSGRLDQLHKLIIENASHAPAFSNADISSSFQDMVMLLNHLVESGYKGCAQTLAIYAVALAEYEWKDRLRGGIPYDEEVHGKLSFAIANSQD